MKDDELFKIPEEALRKIKSLKEYDDYFHELYKQGIEAMLKAEMGEHLGYPLKPAAIHLYKNPYRLIAHCPLPTAYCLLPTAHCHAIRTVLC